MPLVQPVPSWVGLVKNCLNAKKPIRETRATIAQTLAKNLTFPHRTHFRGLVVAQRILRADRAVEYWDIPREQDLPCMIVIPEGFGKAAYAATGGVILYQREPLQAGSVIDVECSLFNPMRYTLQPPGLVARIHHLRPIVAVQR